MTRKSVSVLLLFALFLNFIQVTSVSAVNEPEISITATTPDANGDFTATVAVKNNPGLAAFTLRLRFDTISKTKA